MRRIAAALKSLDPGRRAAFVEAFIRLAGVVCVVVFADFFGTRWAWLAAGLGLFVLTSERTL